MERIVTTEMRNPASLGIDQKSTLEILRIINLEDQKVAVAVSTCLPQISNVVDAVVRSFDRGGRLLYIGAGTSGRLGVLDASECPPTYGVGPEMVQGIIAGGQTALTTSIEGAEDDGEAGVHACMERGLDSRDVLIGITANGGARFVVDAMKYAQGLGCPVSAISCNESTEVFDIVPPEMRIFIPVGPEIIAGSTRMKSGTAQKLVLNMITTTAMIRIGKVYNNLMVDLKPVNAKLKARAIRMIMEITGCSEECASDAFRRSGENTKKAIVMVALDIDESRSQALLAKEGRLGELFKDNPPRHIRNQDVKLALDSGKGEN